MSKYYGARCTGVGSDCADDPYAWCERFDNGCTGGSIGDYGLEGKAATLSRLDFHRTMRESATKFLLDRGGTVVEPGMLADAGLREGDELIGILAVASALAANEYYSLSDSRREILTWQFNAPLICVSFRRDGKDEVGVMKNPAHQ